MTKPLSVTLIVMVGFLIVKCATTEDNEPEDQLQKPPAPPQLLLPLPDTAFPCNTTCHIPFDWVPVTGAEIYEIQSDTSSTFSTASIHQANVPPTTIGFVRYGLRTTYFWRIRAGSTLWTWYTAWSDSRKFDLVPEMYYTW